MNPTDSIDHKILCYFNGQLTDKEEAELLEWIKQSEKNKQYFFKVKEELDPDKMSSEFVKSSYAELKSRLVINNEFKRSVSGGFRYLRISLPRVAAMLVLAITLGFSVAYLLTNTRFQKEEIVWFESQTPRGEKSRVLLPDGSLVWLNSESSITYPADFMKGNRIIKLTGEAYFDVAKLPSHEPFIVQTPSYAIRVLGTQFNVMAYADFDRTETSLIEGKIEIQYANQVIDVAPGESFVFKNNKYQLKKTNAAQSAMWKDDVFDFDQITFEELVRRLERWYDVDIEIKSEQLKSTTYSGAFKNEETLEEVLTTFELSMPVRFQREDFRKFSIDLKK